jgi:DNA-damage-inducible protein J
MAQLNIKVDDPGAIPFRTSTQNDPLYNPANIARVKSSISQFKKGKFSEKSMEELDRIAGE